MAVCRYLFLPLMPRLRPRRTRSTGRSKTVMIRSSPCASYP